MPDVPRVVHVRDRVPGAIFIGRGSPFGNPFIIGRDGTRDEVIDKYRAWLFRDTKYAETLQYLIYRDLKGRDLACFCAPLSCHGDVLLELANS